MPTITVENYLKAIFLLQGNSPDPVSLGKLADELHVTAGTVTLMIQRLSDSESLVDYRRREGVRLTPKGRSAALRVLRRHRLIELFLVQVVGMEWHEVHEEAEELEHTMSDRLIQRIDDMLGNPDYDPHGAPIPSARGKMPEEMRIPLSQANRGKLHILQLRDDSESFRRFAAHEDLLPGKILKLLSHDPDADTVTVLREGNSEPLRIGGAAARKILVSQT